MLKDRRSVTDVFICVLHSFHKLPQTAQSIRSNRVATTHRNRQPDAQCSGLAGWMPQLHIYGTEDRTFNKLGLKEEVF